MMSTIETHILGIMITVLTVVGVIAICYLMDKIIEVKNHMANIRYDLEQERQKDEFRQWKDDRIYVNQIKDYTNESSS